MAFPLTDAEHQAIRNRVDGQDELIVAAAVQFDGATVSFPRPARHGDCINWLSHHGIKRGHQYDCGFLTNRGRFVDRQEAGRIVLANGQGSPGGTPENNPYMALYSEDMWNEDDEPAHIDPADIFAPTLPQEPTP